MLRKNDQQQKTEYSHKTHILTVRQQGDLIKGFDWKPSQVKCVFKMMVLSTNQRVESLSQSEHQIENEPKFKMSMNFMKFEIL